MLKKHGYSEIVSCKNMNTGIQLIIPSFFSYFKNVPGDISKSDYHQTFQLNGTISRQRIRSLKYRCIYTRKNEQNYPEKID